MQGGIGKDGRIPWHDRNDLANFRKVTLDKTVVMGRKTHESIGRPLDRRLNVVLSRTQPENRIPGVIYHHDPARMLRETIYGEMFIIGGAEIYAYYEPFCDRLYRTIIPNSFMCDTFMPEIDCDNYYEVGRTVTATRHEIIYNRKEPGRDILGRNEVQ